MTVRDWLSFRNALIAAVTLAIMAFLINDDYKPGLGIVGNVMWADINLGVTIPYRWFLAALVVFVAGVGIWERSTKSN